VLEITILSVSYGGLSALRDVTLSAKEGQFVTVVGPNGAGKSTLFKTISGILLPVAGRISFMGQICLVVRRHSGRIWGSPMSRRGDRCSRP
jgi:branched-chain amino acid transport system ATP-binding protein